MQDGGRSNSDDKDDGDEGDELETYLLLVCAHPSIPPIRPTYFATDDPIYPSIHSSIHPCPDQASRTLLFPQGGLSLPPASRALSHTAYSPPLHPPHSTSSRSSERLSSRTPTSTSSSSAAHMQQCGLSVTVTMQLPVYSNPQPQRQRQRQRQRGRAAQRTSTPSRKSSRPTTSSSACSSITSRGEQARPKALPSSRCTRAHLQKRCHQLQARHR